METTTSKASKGGKASKETVKAAVAAVTGLSYEADVIRVPVTMIDRNPTWNLTRQDEQGIGDVSGLMRELEADGQRVPVEAARTGERFRLAAGFRRCEAIAKLHKAGKHDGQVLVRVLTAADPLTLALANVRENEDLGRLQVTWLGRSIGYQALQAQGMSALEISRTVGRAEDVVRDALRFSKADPRCRAAIVADAMGKPVPVSAPAFDKATRKVKTDKSGAPIMIDVDQEGVAWGVVRLVMRKPVAEQGFWLEKVAGLSVKAAAAALNPPKVKEEEAEEEIEEESDGEGGGETHGPGEATEALRAMIATSLIPVFADLVARHERITETLKDDDVDGALAANTALNRALRNLSAEIIKLAGQDNVDRAKDAVRAERRGR